MSVTNPGFETERSPCAASDRAASQVLGDSRLNFFPGYAEIVTNGRAIIRVLKWYENWYPCGMVPSVWFSEYDRPSSVPKLS